VSTREHYRLGCSPVNLRQASLHRIVDNTPVVQNESEKTVMKVIEQYGLFAGCGLRVVVGKVVVAESASEAKGFDVRWAEWQAGLMARLTDAPEGIEPRLIAAHEAACYV
jgi:hypothetical protein